MKATRNGSSANGQSRPALPDSLWAEDLLVEDEQPHDWVIDGLLERFERAILAARAGLGKSTLFRQIATMACSGLHPFTAAEIPPIKVLLVDLENRRRKVRSKLDPLIAAAGDRFQQKSLSVAFSDGLNFDSKKRSDELWLEKKVRRYHPDLLMIGPLYKMGKGDPNKEEFAQPIIEVLDRVMSEFSLALMIESHPGYHTPGRPSGCATWERWPDYGLALDAKGKLAEYRPPRGDGLWPKMLERGGEWPWTPVLDLRKLVWNEIVVACKCAGEKLSMGDLAATLDMSKTKVAGVIGKGGPYEVAWGALRIDPEEIFYEADR